MSRRPSITSAFSSFSETENAQETNEAPAKSPSRIAAGVIGVTARTLTDIRQERDDLREQLAKGSGPREIDAALFDPSPFPDRLSDAGDPDFDALKKLIEEEGQKVAIQARPHPSKSGRYQVIFGHRRWRAAMELGRPVRAEIIEASDEQVAVAQGIENSARQNLTWIERALFAWRLSESGIRAREIRAALSVDDAEIARFRTVCRALPQDVIESIGRAPRIGRPRWIELSGVASASPANVAEIRKTLSADKVSELSSDERFRQVLAKLQSAAKPSKASIELRGSSGAVIGSLATTGSDVRISLDKKHAAAFASFLETEMPSLIERFLASEGAETS